MAGEVTEAVKASVGCLFWMAVISDEVLKYSLR